MNQGQIDELRRQLRALGYLDAGVDRFLLAPARGSRGPLALAARSSVRVGLLGGVLLGPAAAIGLGARLPGLVSGVRDAAVLSIYLAAMFFLAVTVTAFLLSVGASAVVRGPDDRFAKRASLSSASAGWIIGAACLMYLTFWWRNANAGFGWSAPVWTAFALVVAVGISWLLGHAVRITTLAVLAAGRGVTAQLPPVTMTSWRAVVGGGTLAFAGAAILLILTAPGASTDERPALTVVPTGKRLRVIAIDGFDLSSSPSPTTGLLAAAQGRHAAIAAEDLSDPARAWTTIATGAAPNVHGVHGIETRRVAGLRGILSDGNGRIAWLVRAGTDVIRLTRPSIASRAERRVKTVWEVASDAGLRTAVVNWWATWPAPSDNGIVVTDRAVVRLEQGGPLDAEIAPASLYDTMKVAWPGIRARAQQVAERHFAGVGDREVSRTLVRSAELDATVIGIFETLPGPPRDLDIIYLPGLDIAQHALLSSAGGTSTPSAIAAKIEALRSYYRFLDDAIVPLVQQDNPALMVALILQPGRVGTAADGNIAITNAAPSTDVVVRIKPVDLAPTIAYALGLPLSRELPGTAQLHLFDRTFADRFAVRYVNTYGHPTEVRALRTGRPLDQEMIDRLRSLGYVK